MPRLCTICSHKKHPAIDAALLSGEESYQKIAKRFGIGLGAVFSHRKHHLPAHLLKAKELQESEGASDLVQRLRRIHDETLSILSRAKKSKDWSTALRAIARLERQIELEAELLGELERGGGDSRVEVVYIDKALIAPGVPVAPGRVIEAAYQKA